jgi:hypothetical protein
MVEGVLQMLDRSPVAKHVGGVVANLQTPQLGAMRGGVHAAMDLAELAMLAQRLNDPYDELRSPPGESARDHVASAAAGARDYIARGVAHPQTVVDDVEKVFDHANKGLNPFATPQAETFLGEIERQRQIDLNVGETTFNVMAPVKGVPALTAARAVPYAERVAGYVAEGHLQDFAEYLAEAYDGMGHHAIIPRRLAGKWGLPNWVRDNPLNVVQGAGQDKLQFLRDHFGVDRHLYGGRVARRSGQRGWSGAKLGWERYGPMRRLWSGTPEAMKEALATMGLTPSAALSEGQGGDEQ